MRFLVYAAGTCVFAASAAEAFSFARMPTRAVPTQHTVTFRSALHSDIDSTSKLAIVARPQRKIAALLASLHMALAGPMTNAASAAEPCAPTRTCMRELARVTTLARNGCEASQSRLLVLLNNDSRTKYTTSVETSIAHKLITRQKKRTIVNIASPAQPPALTPVPPTSTCAKLTATMRMYFMCAAVLVFLFVQFGCSVLPVYVASGVVACVACSTLLRIQVLRLVEQVGKQVV
jgi:hypothetical protein